MIFPPIQLFKYCNRRLHRQRKGAAETQAPFSDNHVLHNFGIAWLLYTDLDREKVARFVDFLLVADNGAEVLFGQLLHQCGQLFDILSGG